MTDLLSVLNTLFKSFPTGRRVTQAGALLMVLLLGVTQTAGAYAASVWVVPSQRAVAYTTASVTMGDVLGEALQSMPAAPSGQVHEWPLETTSFEAGTDSVQSIFHQGTKRPGEAGGIAYEVQQIWESALDVAIRQQAIEAELQQDDVNAYQLAGILWDDPDAVGKTGSSKPSSSSGGFQFKPVIPAETSPSQQSAETMLSKPVQKAPGQASGNVVPAGESKLDADKRKATQAQYYFDKYGYRSSEEVVDSNGEPVQTASAVSGLLTQQSVNKPALNTRLIIDRGQRKLLIMHGDQVYKTFPVGVGRQGFATPRGQFQVIRKVPNPIWENPYRAKGAMQIPAGQGNPLGTRWIGFHRDGKGEYGIHGTNRPGSVGQYSSHGCVRMYIRDAEVVYDLVEMGTPVEVR